MIQMLIEYILPRWHTLLKQISNYALHINNDKATFLAAIDNLLKNYDEKEKTVFIIALEYFLREFIFKNNKNLLKAIHDSNQKSQSKNYDYFFQNKKISHIFLHILQSMRDRNLQDIACFKKNYNL